jgi:hypothetical protein
MPLARQRVETRRARNTPVLASTIARRFRRINDRRRSCLHGDNDMLHCEMVKMPLYPIARQYSSDAMRASSAAAVSFAARIAAQRIGQLERQAARG